MPRPNYIAAKLASSGADPCCCPPPDCSLFWQVKSGTASLCGIAEFTTPSSPPKKYRTNTISGSGSGCRYRSSSTCSSGVVVGFGFSGTTSWSGAYQYDRVTCAITNGFAVASVFDADFGSCGAGGGGTGGGTPTVPFDPTTGAVGAISNAIIFGTPYVTETVQRLSITWALNNVCLDEGGGQSSQATGSVNEALTDEDTEDDAIARANAGIGSWTPCTPFSESNCSAYKVLRGAGVFDLAYRSAQVQFSADGTNPGVVYEVTINLQRRLQGTSDPFVDFATITDEFVGPGTGHTFLSGWYDLPAASGYEVAANKCTITFV